MGYPDAKNIDHESQSESESESEEENVLQSEPSKKAINNHQGLLDKLADISWPENVDWIHKLTVDIDREQEVDVNDDLTRELDFYTQALGGARQAFTKFQSMKLPFLRPPDYYAEMVKSDSHMVKVKGRLLSDKKQMEEAEERRKARESKKIAKEVQSEKLKERSKQKKEEMEKYKKLRKQTKQGGFSNSRKDEADLDLSFENGNMFEKSESKRRRTGVAPGDRSGGKGGRQGGGAGAKGGKRKGREHKDSKFGHGGRKGMKKQNTKETTNDFRSFDNGSKGKGGASGDRKRKR
ncbi:probable rRNA-processing protein EBP2 homolog [Impatiens glandulifera]|uniref:probable rRNA-processing protein EBP2 homolog n=1 Tax=Impatiens glandulifera TaxID=253017 RepID=UPI001FB05C25|nr:probable rRNA-processing protein EBP2 homolog [Impatiens glandulifera]